jgi:O-antigen ligase
MWFMRQWFGQTLVKRLIEFSMSIVVAGIYFSYTRAAWVCIPLAVVAYGLIRFRLMRAAIPLALAAGILITGWMAYENRYLEFSPDYEKAITHQKFDALVSATYKLEDISTVERFYRWVAGYYMVKERPLLGFGPSSFYSSYHSYIDRHFTTYVSDNPEHSGIHNYYLMTAVEQGLPGLVIFLILISLTLLIGESTWHRISDKKDRQLLMAGLISFVCNLFILTLNDTVETEKMGTFFFISIALVIFYNQQTKRAEP